MSIRRKKRIYEQPVLEVKAKGPGVRRGRIPVPDLIRICEEAQRAVNRQAEAMEGRKTLHPGPIADSIRHECTLELIGLKPGSTRLQFGLAKPQVPLFRNQPTMASDVIGEVALAIKSFGNGKGGLRDVDAGVLQALYSLGAVAETKRITQIEWISPGTAERKRVAAPVNQRMRDRVAATISSPRKVQRQIDGVLDMADFKPNDLKCRIDPAIGASVICTFDERDSTQIQLLMRNPVRVVGEAVIAPYSDRIETLHIQTIERLPSLSLGKGNFFAESSLSELAASQKVKPLKDISAISSGFPDDEDVDAFLEEIYSARK